MNSDVVPVFQSSDFHGAVQAWLNSGGDANARHPISDATLLHAAAELRDHKSIEILVSAGANLNARDKSGQTPLHIAVDSELDRQGNTGGQKLHCVQRLLDLGADPKIADNRGRTPADWAAGYGPVAFEEFNKALMAKTRTGQ